MVRVAINGFGRIGRMVFKLGINEPGIEFVAINDLTDVKTLAHLLKYDSVFGKFEGTIDTTNDSLIVNGKQIKILAEKDINKLPWKKLNIDIVIESTGLFTDRANANVHLINGAKKVLISAPAKNPDITIVKGVNEHLYDKKKHNIISNASCTTNCLAPMVKVLNDNFGVEYGFMNTAHAYSNDQRILDLPHSDLRRARAAAINIIPTTTGATDAVCLAYPRLRGKINGFSLRVPIANGSLVDLTAELKKGFTIESLNKALENSSKGKLKGILGYTEDEIVSSDVIGTSESGIVDGLSTQKEGNLAKLLVWYDNEYGYSNRVVDVLKEFKRFMK